MLASVTLFFGVLWVTDLPITELLVNSVLLWLCGTSERWDEDTCPRGVRAGCRCWSRQCCGVGPCWPGACLLPVPGWRLVDTKYMGED